MNIYKTIKCVCIIKLILVNYNNNANDSPYPGHAKYIVMEHNFLDLEKNTIFNDSKGSFIILSSIVLIFTLVPCMLSI